jgi:hypothetical protein
MRLLLGLNEPKLVGLALDVLAQRRSLTVEDLEWALGSKDPRVEWLVARALGTNIADEQAFQCLERIYVEAESGSDLHLTALESGIRRCHPVARRELRRLLERPTSGAGIGRACALLGLSGNARDFELLMAAAQIHKGPLALEGLGRLGHVGAIPYLLQLIDEQDEVAAPAAAKELERITGAGLFDVVEEPWVKELPPEVADMDIPIPMKKVRRVSTNPARWREWERANGQRFDPLKKHRSGVPFAPPQLLAELEALEPRPDERERVALELAAATGKDFGFRSNDWVAGQQRAFGRMREYFEKHGFEAGTWCFAGSGIAARPERKLDPAAAEARSRDAAAMPWQFDVVLAAEGAAEAPPQPVVEESSGAIIGQDEIPEFLRVNKPPPQLSSGAQSAPIAAEPPISPARPAIPSAAEPPVVPAQPQPIAQPLAPEMPRPQPIAQPLAPEMPQPQPIAQPLAPEMPRPQPIAQPLAPEMPRPQPIAQPLVPEMPQPLAHAPSQLQPPPVVPDQPRRPVAPATYIGQVQPEQPTEPTDAKPLKKLPWEE